MKKALLLLFVGVFLSTNAYAAPFWFDNTFGDVDATLLGVYNGNLNDLSEINPYLADAGIVAVNRTFDLYLGWGQDKDYYDDNIAYPSSAAAWPSGSGGAGVAGPSNIEDVGGEWVSGTWATFDSYNPFDSGSVPDAADVIQIYILKSSNQTAIYYAAGIGASFGGWNTGDLGGTKLHGLSHFIGFNRQQVPEFGTGALLLSLLGIGGIARKRLRK